MVGFFAHTLQREDLKRVERVNKNKIKKVTLCAKYLPTYLHKCFYCKQVFLLHLQ